MQKNKSKYSELINDLSRNISYKGKISPEELLNNTIYTWRDNLTIDEAIQVLTNLPPFLKELFIHNWKPSQNSKIGIANLNLKETLIQVFKINHNQNISGEDIELIIFTVFKLLEKHVESSKMMSIKSCMPNTVKNFNFYSVDKAA